MMAADIAWSIESFSHFIVPARKINGNVSVNSILILSFLYQVGLNGITPLQQLSYYNLAFKTNKLAFKKLTQFCRNKLINSAAW